MARRVATSGTDGPAMLIAPPVSRDSRARCPMGHGRGSDSTQRRRECSGTRCTPGGPVSSTCDGSSSEGLSIVRIARTTGPEWMPVVHDRPPWEAHSGGEGPRRFGRVIGSTAGRLECETQLRGTGKWGRSLTTRTVSPTIYLPNGHEGRKAYAEVEIEWVCAASAPAAGRNAVRPASPTYSSGAAAADNASHGTPLRDFEVERIGDRGGRHVPGPVVGTAGGGRHGVARAHRRHASGRSRADGTR